MNREKLQQLSTERIEDAQALLAASRWSGAYYLAGYALECALKSCVLVYVARSGVIFINRKFAEKCWTHDLEDLIEYADLKDQLKALSDKPLGQNWAVAKDWNIESRYNEHTQVDAENLVTAINDDTDGVLQWVKTCW